MVTDHLSLCSLPHMHTQVLQNNSLTLIRLRFNVAVSYLCKATNGPFETNPAGPKVILCECKRLFLSVVINVKHILTITPVFSSNKVNLQHWEGYFANIIGYNGKIPY